MIAIGSTLQVVSMLMLSLARQHKYYEVHPILYLYKDNLTFLDVVQVFLAQAIGMGLGQSLLFLPSLSIIGHYFKRRRALATGVAVSVS